LGSASALSLRLGDWMGWIALFGMGAFLAADVVTARRETLSR